MRANRKTKTLYDRAEVGIGTLIVFIAMVLVAAVAAGVLINTTGGLQTKAQKTGKAATENVASNIELQGVYGKVASNKLTNVYYHIATAPGSSPVDLSTMKLRYTFGTAAPVMLSETGTAAAGGTPTATAFGATWLRKNGAGSASILQPGELVELNIDATLDLDGTGAGAAGDWQPGTGQNVQVRIFPTLGSPMDADFTTPFGFGSDSYVTLR